MTAATPIPPQIWVAIPVRNNAGTIRRVALECHEITPNVIVIDDGSTDADLRKLLADTGIPVVRHEVNRGKGAALLTAAREIQNRGGATMIAIDGDGQHEPGDLPAFIPPVTKNPDAIVIGVRDMSGENVPDSSRFGRKFSDFWLRLETGLPLRDTQSGFRAYPVAHFLALGCVGRKYDFEIEILVRAAWAGLPILHVPIRVWYPPAAERVSSFRPFRDNLWITHRHVLLCLRRLLPFHRRKLVAKSSTRLPSAKVRGTALGFWFFITACRFTGLRGAYGLLFIVCSWYAIFDSPIIDAALAYLKRRFPSHGPLRQRWNVYQLFIAQGRAFIDRYYLLNGGDQLRFHKCHFERIRPLLAQKQGFLLLTAHAGNWQVAMTSLEGWNKNVHLLMRPNENPVRDGHLRLYQLPEQIRIINPEGYLGGVLEVMKALDDGDIVSVMGDRDYDGSRKVDVDFLGGTAGFPVGGFLMAHATGRPIAVLLSAKTGPYDYDVTIAGIIEPRPGESKRAFLQRGPREYACILEEFFQKYPFQCFLFQDIWTGKKPVTV